MLSHCLASLAVIAVSGAMAPWLAWDINISDFEIAKMMMLSMLLFIVVFVVMIIILVIVAMPVRGNCGVLTLVPVTTSGGLLLER